jgi:hypothetical protein
MHPSASPVSCQERAGRKRRRSNHDRPRRADAISEIVPSQRDALRDQRWDGGRAPDSALGLGGPVGSFTNRASMRTLFMAVTVSTSCRGVRAHLRERLRPTSQRVLRGQLGGLLPLPRGLDRHVLGLRPDHELARGVLRRGARPRAPGDRRVAWRVGCLFRLPVTHQSASVIALSCQRRPSTPRASTASRASPARARPW